MVTKDGIKFKKLDDAFAAFDRGELPKGTKFFICTTSTILLQVRGYTG